MKGCGIINIQIDDAIDYLYILSMIPRRLAPTLLRLAESFPIVTITGPRQSGKTTLARACFGDRPYISLEDPTERSFAKEDPRGFLDRFKHGAIFDEAQRWPELFSHLQGIVDQDRTPGRFILTGSQQFGLLAGITQSLAGRAAVTTLLPLSLEELRTENGLQAEIDTTLLNGGYPSLHAQKVTATDWLSSYVATYLERDVRQVLNIKDLGAFQRFLRLCAGRTGQLLNLSNLASETGISHSTASAWLSVLESSHLIYLLQPYHRNFGKRLVKTPKLYFLDTGLACWLLSIRNTEALSLSPYRGAIFETLIVTEFIKAQFNAGGPIDLYFWRDNNGLEADLLFESGQKLQTIEIKSGKTVTADYVHAGQKSARFAATEALPPCLIYGGEDNYERSGVRFFSWRHLDLNQSFL